MHTDINTDTIVLATRWLNQPALGDRPSRTLLAGAATLTVSHRFGGLGFDLAADSSTITDDPARTLAWLTNRLPSTQSRLLLWRAEDIVVPSLIAAAETARDTTTAARLLRALNMAFEGEVIDVADRHGGVRATSFDAIANGQDVPFLQMNKPQLDEAHRTGCHGDIQHHLAARVKAMWQLWIRGRNDSEMMMARTASWLASPEAELRF